MQQEQVIAALSAVLGLPETLEELNQMFEVVIPDAIEVLDGLPTELAVLYDQMAQVHKRLAGSLKDIEDALIDAMPTKQFMVEGIGEIEWHSANSRKAWQHDQLVPRVNKVVAEDVTVWHDFDTGEEIAPVERRQEIVDRVVERLRMIASLSWKVGKKRPNGEYEGGLRSVELDPDEFCTTEWGRKRVTFPTNDELV